MSYFEDGGTLPPPFNLFPTTKLLRCGSTSRSTKSLIVSIIFGCNCFFRWVSERERERGKKKPKNENRTGFRISRNSRTSTPVATHTRNTQTMLPQFDKPISLLIRFEQHSHLYWQIAMISTKINTNDSSNPLDKQFICGVRCVFLYFFCRRLSFSLGPYKLCLFLFFLSLSLLLSPHRLLTFFLLTVSFDSYLLYRKGHRTKRKNVMTM